MYVLQEYVPQILNVDDVGQKKHYEDYVTERIKVFENKVKEQNNKMYLSGSKKETVKIHDQIIDMRETKNLYGRKAAC